MTPIERQPIRNRIGCLFDLAADSDTRTNGSKLTLIICQKTVF